MCGITGIFHLNNSKTIDPILLSEMTDSIKHRGPDDHGYWFCNTKTNNNILTREINSISNNSFNLAFGHRRLSILDLSPLGHQPMSNKDGSVWITYNGEVYNYIELKEELISKGYVFNTGTDTEVIISAYEEWGEDCVKKFNGMFAFAIWDQRKQQLFIARDRFGIKPFYYCFWGDALVFSSEIKSMLKIQDLKLSLNKRVIHNYISMYPDIIENQTFFNEIHEVPPAHFGIINSNNNLSFKNYWILDPQKSIYNISSSEYVEQFYDLFDSSIKLRLRSDVPVGTCLSGGLDSSTIVCMTSKYVPNIHTFSACFDEKEIDERPFIQNVIDKTNAMPNYTFPSVDKLLNDVDSLIWHQDEPFGSASIFAQWCVMELVKKNNVTVLLDGQGADEILAGYTMHFPAILFDYLKQYKISNAFNEYKGLKKNHHLSDKQLLWYSGLLLPDSIKRFYNPSVTWINSNSFKDMINTKFTKSNSKPDFKTGLNKLLYQSLSGTLRNLLRYEDRNSMAFSIESRVPFLDYRLVEYMYALPLNQKINNGVSKYVLRESMENILPDEVRNRQDKIGFLTPEFKWFQEPAMKKFILDIIQETANKDSDFYNNQVLSDMIKNLPSMPIKEAIKTGKLFWRIVNLELWMKKVNVKQG